VIPHGDESITLRFGNKSLAEEPYTILFAGRILRYKGLNFLLEAFEKVLTDFPEAKLIIAGSGDISPYKKAIEGLGNTVEVHNRMVGDDEFANFFRRAAIIVLPHIEGSQSGLLITGCTFGKAIICTNVGSFSEVIENGVNGIVIEPGNVAQLSEAIKNLLGNPELRLLFGQRAKQKAMTELSWEKIAALTSNVYDKLGKF
jgi:glycosyltransferase involved in cell wall biosynthesis